MVQKIISTELREQAGSDSYNRFEYQVHWIVYHMINEFKRDSKFYIFCEFHDDMTKTDFTTSPECAEFFQIKTSIQFKEWTFPRLFNTYKKQGGGFKHSFLGFIFYNFLNFGNECSKCHFISNIGMDSNVRKWQACIEDGKKLEEEEPELFEEIQSFIRKEYEELPNEVFTSTFEVFVQNTYLYDGNLSLDNYEKVVAGEFFQMLDNDDIYTSNSNKILRDIIEDVRKKSKYKINVPISYNSLIKNKGVSSEIFGRLKDQLSNQPNSEKVYEKLEEFLLELNYKSIRRSVLINKLKRHYVKILDSNNIIYQDFIDKIENRINKSIVKHYDKIDDLEFLCGSGLEEIINSCQNLIDEDVGIDGILIEVLFYEKLV